MNGSVRTNKTNPYRPTLLTGWLSVFALFIAIVHSPQLAARSFDSSGTVLQSTDYYPFGLAFADADIASNRYLYNGKELEDYTIGTAYLGTLDYGARHYDPRIARWSVPDSMEEKYYGVNAYGYCAGNPVMMVDTNGKEWRDSKGNKIVDHSNIHVYIFYDPKSFKRQSNKMYHDAVVKYGERSVAMSDVTTVQDLPAPTGDISHAQLNLNTCKSNSKTQHELKGSRQTLMEAFFNSFDFKTVRGTSHGVSYDNLWKPSYQRNSGVGLPSK